MKLVKYLKIAILLLSIIIVMIGFIYYNRGKIFYKIDEQPTTDEEFKESYRIDENIQVVNVRNNYYIVKSCIEKFYEYNTILLGNTKTEYYSADKDIVQKEYEQNIKSVYDMLDIEYIEAKGINQLNVLNRLEAINKSTVNITNMYVSEKTSNINVYIVEGNLIENEIKKIIPFKAIVKLDLSNRTFSIIPNNYVKEKYPNISKGENIDLIQVPEKIDKKGINQYIFKSILDETYIIDLMEHYKYNALYITNVAYDDLDVDYKNKRFGTVEEYQNYITNNVTKYRTLTLDKYQKTIEDGYTQYVCIDTNGNYYIFRETATMQYTLLLDTYTIDIPEFTKKYNQADNETKVGMNIEKIKSALNNKDYNYIYSKLADSFKVNYFPTVDSLKQYLQTNLFANNTLEYDSVDNEGKNYMFDINFKDATNTVEGVVSKRVIMQLKEGTDFVFSFNV